MNPASERNFIRHRLTPGDHIRIRFFVRQRIFPRSKRKIFGDNRLVFVPYEHIRPRLRAKPVFGGEFANLPRMAEKHLGRIFIAVKFTVFPPRHHKRFVHSDVYAASPETFPNGVEKSVYKPINTRFIH